MIQILDDNIKNISTYQSNSSCYKLLEKLVSLIYISAIDYIQYNVYMWLFYLTLVSDVGDFL